MIHQITKKDGTVVEFDTTILDPAGVGLDPLLTQQEAEYVNPSPRPDQTCVKCAFFNGANCNLVLNYPAQIEPTGWCVHYTALEILADPAGVSQMSTTVTPVHEMAHDLPLASGDPAWDAGAARARIWKWATDSDGNFDITKAAQAFLVRDGDTKGDLKDPIADVIDGHLEVIPAALRAASSRLPQTDDAGTGGAAAALAHYKKLAHIGEFERAALEDFVISEYKGDIPDVPNAADIDMDSLTTGDANPTFVVRPIAQVGRTSKNGIQYDQALVSSLAEQINTNHPIGIFGHIKDEDRSTAHPLPQAYWVGAKQYGKKLYAKAYIADPARAADIRKKKALNSADGTSIYGGGKKIKGEDGATLLREFHLESLDFAPVDRASLDMGKEMYITAEMTDGDPAPNTPNHPMEVEMTEAEMRDAVLAHINTLTPEQMTTLLGADKAKQVSEQYTAANNLKIVAAEMEVVDKAVIAEMGVQTNRIAELELTVNGLKDVNAGYKKQTFATALASAIEAATPYAGSDPKLKSRTDETRQILELKAKAALGANLDTAVIAETVNTVVANSVPLMEMWRDTLMGPSAVILGKNDNRKAGSTGYYTGAKVDDPEFQEEARTRVGV